MSAFPLRPTRRTLAGRRPLVRSVLLLALLSASGAHADPPPPTTGTLIALKGGQALSGRIVRTTEVAGRPHAVVATDFGEILIDAAEMVDKPSTAAAPPPSEATFVAGDVRVVAIRGPVRRKSPGDADWTSISEDAGYASAPKALPKVSPGDALRTGPGATVELLLHRDVWIRIAPDSEVEIPKDAARGSFSLLRGTTVHDVRSRPGGEVFRVGTPSNMLGVRGTRFQVSVTEDGGSTAVLEGTVDLEGRAAVAARHEAQWQGAEAPRITPITPRVESELKGLRPGYRPADDMVYVPAGEYLVGADGSRPAPASDPTHGSTFVSGFARAGKVRSGAFLIDRREVSLGDYAAYVSAMTGPAQPPLRTASEREPMYDIDDQAAVSYARWVGKQLPTATQWEIAARGRDGRPFPWGRAPLDRPLVMGTWTGTGRTAADPLRWEPPAPGAPWAINEELDVSPFGVTALASGVPEYVRWGTSTEPLWAMLTPAFQGALQAAEQKRGFGRSPVRGVHGSLLAIDLLEGSVGVGFRCVVELPPSR